MTTWHCRHWRWPRGRASRSSAPRMIGALLTWSRHWNGASPRARSLAVLERARAAAGYGRLDGVATRGGVAGATYVNPVLLVRPLPDLAVKLGAVVASATTSVVDPSSLAARGVRTNFDGGSPFGRSLGTELDVGTELTVPLDAPMELRLSVEGAVAFPGSAFADADGGGLGTQALTTAGLGLTF